VTIASPIACGWVPERGLVHTYVLISSPSAADRAFVVWRFDNDGTGMRAKQDRQVRETRTAGPST